MPNKKPGAVSRPGTLREFQFPESTELHGRVKPWVLSLVFSAIVIAVGVYVVGAAILTWSRAVRT
jgi:hypothetical protein